VLNRAKAIGRAGFRRYNRRRADERRETRLAMPSPSSLARRKFLYRSELATGIVMARRALSSPVCRTVAHREASDFTPIFTTGGKGFDMCYVILALLAAAAVGSRFRTRLPDRYCHMALFFECLIQICAVALLLDGFIVRNVKRGRR
jgi:hypothetical protein